MAMAISERPTITSDVSAKTIDERAAATSRGIRARVIRACSSKEAFEEMVKEVEAGDPYKGDEVRVEQKGVAEASQRWKAK